MYPTPVWGRAAYLVTAQVHLYGAGTNGRPVLQSYTLTGSTCIGPPVGKLPEGGTRASVGRPAPPQPCLATNPPTTGLKQGAHLGGKTGGKGTRKGRGGGGAQEGWATVSCEVSCIVKPAAGGTGHRVHPFSHVHSSHSLR